MDCSLHSHFVGSGGVVLGSLQLVSLLHDKVLLICMVRIAFQGKSSSNSQEEDRVTGCFQAQAWKRCTSLLLLCHWQEQSHTDQVAAKVAGKCSLWLGMHRLCHHSVTMEEGETLVDK